MLIYRQLYVTPAQSTNQIEANYVRL
jgi:hypothetical protein